MTKPVVLITGASRGIGRAASMCFAENGYRIVINALNNSIQLKETEKILSGMNAEFITVRADISSPYETAVMFSNVRDQFGGIDILVNNAGTAYTGLTSKMSIDEWNKVINTNLSSVFYCCREAMPDMIRKKRGKIINITSVWGACGASCEAAYSAAKGGVNAFTKALAKELAPSGIQVNAIAFGLIDTDMNKNLSNEELLELIEQVPARRIASAEEAGEFIYLTAVNMGSYLTGQVITFDGGWI